MSSNWNKACVGSLHLDDGVSEGFAEGNKDGLDIGILEGSSDDDGPVEGVDESEDGMDDEEGSLDGVLSTQQMRRARSSVVHTE
jgi:hypothetical protein